jgi:hypothetical protein
MQNKKRDYEFWIKLEKRVGRCPIDVNISLKRRQKLNKEKERKTQNEEYRVVSVT